LSALTEDSKETGAKYVEVRPVKPIPTKENNFHKTKGFVLHTLDLRPSVEDLFRSFHKDSIQRKIRRAEREGLSVDEGRNEGLLENFFRLLLITRRRHGLPPPPRTWFKNLIDCFGDQLTIRVANKDGNPIAAVLTLRFRDTLVYKYGASDITLHAVGGMQALIWSAIKAAKHQGLRQLDLGRSDIEDQGLITFKDRWGTARSTISYFRYPLKLSNVSSSTAWGGRNRRRLFEWMPNAILSTAGKLLYRHVG
jgi:lipid II:glycine glycyltransferase (peptidoglycan interpeptide bridge formation enzyme)